MNKSIIKMRLVALSFFIAGSVIAQEKLTKVSQSIKVNKGVTIDLNTSYTNIVFDTWNKDTVEIEAYIEGGNLSKENLNEALKSWAIDVDASSNNVSISTGSNTSHAWSYSINNGDGDAVTAVLEELKFELANLSDVDFDFHFEMPELAELPELPEILETPELPKLPEGINDFHFDYKAYKKDGEKYLEKYTQKFESKYGKDYAKKMEAWGEKFGKEWSEKYGKQMEEWAKKIESKYNNEDYTKKMEALAERLAKQMERKTKQIELQVERTQKLKEVMVKQREEYAKARKIHAEQRKKRAKERKVLIGKLVRKESNSKIKKTIKIKMPKDAKLKVNVRHGELEFASNVNNLKADLSHTKFTAYSINGGSTSINASYSPIHVNNWNLGELNLKYVKDADFNNVKSIVLTSNSSNVNIDNLAGNAIIDGNIGDLKILNIDDAFTNLNILIQNCDAVIALPQVACNIQYKGTSSGFSHPEKPSGKSMSSFTSNKSNTGKTIVVNAKYSNVIMK